jgi:hypothetical protein
VRASDHYIRIKVAVIMISAEGVPCCSSADDGAAHATDRGKEAVFPLAATQMPPRRAVTSYQDNKENTRPIPEDFATAASGHTVASATANEGASRRRKSSHRWALTPPNRMAAIPEVRKRMFVKAFASQTVQDMVLVACQQRRPWLAVTSAAVAANKQTLTTTRNLLAATQRARLASPDDGTSSIIAAAA